MVEVYGERSGDAGSEEEKGEQGTDRERDGKEQQEHASIGDTDHVRSAVRSGLQ